MGLQSHTGETMTAEDNQEPLFGIIRLA